MRARAREGSGAAALAVLAGGQLLIVVDATIVNVALGPIRDGLGFSSAQLSWIVTAYTLAFGGFLIPGGRIADRFGRRRVFMAGVAVFGVASLVGGAAETPLTLVVARAVQGLGAAVLAPAALGLVLEVFPSGRGRRSALGVWAAVTAAGTALGSVLGGVLVEALSWRWVLWINVPVVAAIVLIGLAVVPRSAAVSTGRGDLPGAATVTGGLMALVYALTGVAEYGWLDVRTLAGLVLAAGLLAAFVVVQRRTADRLIPPELLRNRAVVAADVVGLAFGVAIFGLFYFVSLFLSTIKGAGPIAVGLAFVPMALAITIAAQVSARYADRVASGRLAAAGALLVAIGMALLGRLGPESTYLGALLPTLLLAGVGLGAAFVPLTSAAVAGAGQAHAGVASALFNSGQQIGGALGLAVLTTVSAARVSAHPDPASAAATTAGWGLSFLIAAVVALAAAVLAATRIVAVKESI
ncbi:MFS transporter [Kribbella sandramycini]|uniref:EmrB/QacA subfamily drug resistance transporter n=1 Tax=Kribbella sandramycini TaxID=60450 RepID=A0A7Y4KX03_9ACTN|nr:MFS transporter [Kribbella sandramycini]MBB6569968.1 EmrB/QacA subfamily drug resistance transporter [Kribbella sandramycini]NOL40208.1 MFS transporter [Kribbella sandramycini]